MPNGNGDIVRAIYDALREGDIDAARSAMHPDVQWNLAENFPYSEGNPIIGSDTVVARVFTRVPRDWEQFAHHIDKIVTENDTVVVLGRYRAVSRRTGKRVDAQMVHVWELAGGKVVRFQQYTDTAQWRDAARE